MAMSISLTFSSVFTLNLLDVNVVPVFVLSGSTFVHLIPTSTCPTNCRRLPMHYTDTDKHKILLTTTLDSKKIEHY